MLTQVHDHILDELRHSGRTDTVFVLTAIVFNLIVLAVNSSIAGSSDYSSSSLQTDVVLGVMIVLVVIVNALAVAGLSVGRQTRGKLLGGLQAMYRDNGVDKYYDASLLSNYDRRYTLFIAVVLCLAATAVVVPLIVRVL